MVKKTKRTKKPEISIVIPVYKAKNILEKGCLTLQRELKKTDKSFEILYRSDCSPDKPMLVLEKLAKKYPNVRVFEHCPNKGLGATLRQLFADAKGKFIIYMDPDSYFAFDLSQLRSLFAFLDDYDVIVGNRYDSLENIIPLKRKISSYIFFLANRILFGILLRDTGSGLAIYRASVLKKLKLVSNRYEIHTELYKRLQEVKAKIIEIPVKYKHWEGGSFRLFHDSSETALRTFRIWYLLNFKKAKSAKVKSTLIT